HVLLANADGADQHIEAATLCRHLDAAVDDVDEEKALVLVLEGRLIAPPEDDADRFLETVGESPRSAVRHEAELSNRSQHPLAGLRAGSALTVQDSGHRGDGDS